MNRKLRNTYTALASSGGVLALALMMAAPMPRAAHPQSVPVRIGALEFSYTPNRAGTDAEQQARELTRSIERRVGSVDSLSDAAALSAEIATAAALAGALGNADAARVDDEPARSGNKARRRNRQTLAMPYFSFAPRG